MHIKKFGEEVLFADDEIVKVGRDDIEFLKQQAGNNKRSRIRLCTHKNLEDVLHEMFIVHTRGTYVRPHKHLNKAESLHIIEGAVDIIVFGEEGNIINVVRMGDYLSGDKLYHRIPNSYYHSLLIRSDVLVFHEVTNGPFNRSDTVFAPWAPEEDDHIAAKKFMKRLK